MPTVKEKFNEYARNNSGMTKEQVTAKFVDQFGVQPADVKGDTDWGAFYGAHKSGYLKEAADVMRAAGTALTTDALRARPASRKPAPAVAQPTAPTETDAVDLPAESASAPEGELGTPVALPDKGYPRVGGMTDPMPNLERAGGFIKGALEKVMLPAAVGSNIEAYQATGPAVAPGAQDALKNARALAAQAKLLRPAIKEEREKTVEMSMLDRVTKGTLGVVGSPARALNSMTSSFEVAPGQTPYGLGEAFGDKVPAAVLAGAQELIDKPGETILADPVNAATVVLPAGLQFVKAASSIAGATAAGQAVAKAVRGVVSSTLDRAPQWSKRFAERYGRKGLARQQFLDLYEAGNPQATEFLEELLRAPEEGATAAMREVPALESATRARVADDGVYGLGDAETDSLAAIMTKSGATQTPGRGFTLAEQQAVEAAELAARDGAIIKALSTPKGPEIGNIRAQLRTLDGDARYALSRLNKAINEGDEANVAKFTRARNLIRAEAEDVTRRLDSLLAEAGVAPEKAALPANIRDIRARVANPSPDDVAKSAAGNVAESIERGKVSKRKMAIEDEAARGAAALQRGEAPNLVRGKTSEAMIAAAKAIDLPLRTPLERELADFVRVVVDGDTVWASPRVAYAIETDLEVAKVKTAFDKFGHKLTTTGKQVALPLSVKAMLTNLVSNEMLSSVFTGIPFKSTITGISDGIQWARYWSKPVAERAASPRHRFFSAIGETDLIGSNAIEKDVKLIQGLSGYEQLANVGGKIMEGGDVVYKLPVAESGFNRALDVIGDMSDGSTTTVQITPRTAVTLTKRGRVLEVSTPGRGKQASIILGEDGLPANAAGRKIVDSIAARYGSFLAKNLFFDYGDVPSWVKHIRQSRGVGAGSPFYTWAYKSLSIPFVKKGLPDFVMGGPTMGLRTTSLRGNVRLASEAAAVSMRRGILMGVLTKDSPDQEYLREAMNYTPGDTRVQLVNVATDPASTSVASFSGANWAQATLSFVNLGVAAANAIMGADSTADVARKLTAAREKTGPEADQEITKLSRELISKARSPDPITAALGLAGLSGGILMDEYFNMRESGRAGSSYDYSSGFRKMFIPSSVRPIVGAAGTALKDTPVIGPAAAWVGRGMDPEMERFARATNNPEQQSSMWEFATKQILGLGWQHIDSKQSMKWYVDGVSSELLKQADVYYDKHAKDLADTAAASVTGDTVEDEKARAELEKKYEDLKWSVKDMKKAIKTAAKQAKYDWQDAHEREYKRSMTQAEGGLTPAQLRQKAAQQKVGGAK